MGAFGERNTSKKHGSKMDLGGPLHEKAHLPFQKAH